MPKPKKPESFEVAEYSDNVDDQYQVLAVVKQIASELKRESPAESINVSLSGEDLRITFSSFEMFLPSRIKEVEERANDSFREALKFLKKEFKSRTGKTLDLKEKKDLANYSVQKTSLNERYMYVSWRVFDYR